jgi:septum formation protein
VTKLILASASPARTKLLSDAGIAHTVLVSDVDEDAVTAKYGVTDPHDTALLLARAKAEAVAALPEAEGALVLGCDSVFEFEGQAHGKPYTPEVARERIRRMRNNNGILHTGHWLIDCRPTEAEFEDEDPGTVDAGTVDAPTEGSLPAEQDGAAGLAVKATETAADTDAIEEFGTGATVGAVANAAVYFADMTDAEVDAYIATGEPLHVAGSFTIDSLGGAFITKVDGDPHTVVGLSVSTLRQLLAHADVQITDLWQ